MSNVIERLLEVERQARHVIAEAERQAAQTVDEAQAQARRLVAEGRKKAQADADEMLAGQARELEEDRQARLREEASRLPSAETMDPQKLGKAVQFVVKTVAYGAPDAG